MVVKKERYAKLIFKGVCKIIKKLKNFNHTPFVLL